MTRLRHDGDLVALEDGVLARLVAHLGRGSTLAFAQREKHLATRLAQNLERELVEHLLEGARLEIVAVARAPVLRRLLRAEPSQPQPRLRPTLVQHHLDQRVRLVGKEAQRGAHDGAFALGATHLDDVLVVHHEPASRWSPDGLLDDRLAARDRGRLDQRLRTGRHAGGADRVRDGRRQYLVLDRALEAYGQARLSERPSQRHLEGRRAYLEGRARLEECAAEGVHRILLPYEQVAHVRQRRRTGGGERAREHREVEARVAHLVPDVVERREASCPVLTARVRKRRHLDTQRDGLGERREQHGHHGHMIWVFLRCARRGLGLEDARLPCRVKLLDARCLAWGGARRGHPQLEALGGGQRRLEHAIGSMQLGLVLGDGLLGLKAAQVVHKLSELGELEGARLVGVVPLHDLHDLARRGAQLEVTQCGAQFVKVDGAT